MLKLLFLACVLGSLPNATLSSTRTSHDSNSPGQSPTKTRFLRENLYNFRPQSAVIDDEIDFRSYDNNFSPFSNDETRGNYGYKSNSQPFPPSSSLPASNRQSFLDTSSLITSLAPAATTYRDFDEDYNEELDIPDEEEVDPGFRSYPSPPHSYNKRRPSGGARPAPPNPPILAQWDDQSGRQRGDASYSFGFRLPDQSRRESSDVFGNVNGDFSFVDDEGTFRKVVYSAGAHKGFVVNQKVPTDTQLPSPPRRPQHHRKPSPNPIILTEVPQRLPPSRAPNPNSSRRPSSKNHRQVPSRDRDQPTSNAANGGGAGVGIAVGVPNGNGLSSRPSQPTETDGREPERHNTQNIHNSHQQPEDQLGNGENNPAGGNEGNGTGKPWGVLGQTPNSRPRQMRKRKPALVVKVKRPATSTAAPPAWMYYRPPNPRPLAGGADGGDTWTPQNHRKILKPSPTPPPYSDDTSADDNFSGSWTDTDSDNEIDPYPKDKSYSFGYSTGDQQRQEVSDAWGNIRGSYSYVDPAGVTRTVHYTAGNAGFKVLNAQSSNVRPVSIPIPVPVMARLQQFSEIPQPSAVVYHIHPGNGASADWRPWESQRIKSSAYTSRKRRRQRPRQQVLEPLQQSTSVQGNTFHLTPANDRFFPAFTNVYGGSSSSQTRTSKLSADTPQQPVNSRIARPEYEEVVTDDQAYLNYLQQQYRRQKLRQLSRQHQIQTNQPYIQYARQQYYSPRPSKSSRLNNLDRLTNYFITEPGDDSLGVYDDKIYSDYEIAAAIVEAENARLDGRKRSSKSRSHHHKKSRSSSKHSSHTVTQDPDPAESMKITKKVSDQLKMMKTDPSIASPTGESPADKFAMHGEMEIHTYKGGYGDKNPLLVITEMTSTKPTSEPTKSTMKPSPATRPQRQAPLTMSLERMAMLSSERMGIPDNMMAESMQPMDAFPVIMEMVLSTESRSSVSMEGGEKKPTKSEEPNVKMSPAARLAARMASAQQPPSSPSASADASRGSASISAISMPTMLSNSGKLMHFPGGRMETLQPSSSSRENSSG